MVRRLITASAAAAVLGVCAPATARVPDPAFDGSLGLRLERSWTWASEDACGPATGNGRQVILLRTASRTPLGETGGTLRVVGTLERGGRATEWDRSPSGECSEDGVVCAVRRVPVSGSVRVAIRNGAVRLSRLRYRVSGRTGCAPDVPEVRAALRGQPRLDAVSVVDREGKLGNARIPRVTVTGASAPVADVGGAVTGEVRAVVRWSLVLVRR